MIKSKVISILSSFSPDEMKSFEEYLSSPFLNKNVRITELFKLIKKFYPRFDDPNFSKDNLNRKLLGNRKVPDSYLRNLFSDLNKKAEDFLSYIIYREDSNYYILLIKELYYRGNTKSLEEKLCMFEKLIEKDKFKSPTYYYDKAFITEMKTNSKVNKVLADDSRKEDIESKFNFFAISIMESSCQTFIEQHVKGVNIDLSVLNHLLEYIQKDFEKFNKDPLIQIYYYACLCFLNQNSENYFNLFLNIYNLNKKYFSSIDKRNINSLILSYYSDKNQIESGKYYHDALMLYNEMLDNNYLSHTRSGYIDSIALRNIVFLCMNLKDEKSFSSFIKRIDYIVKEDQREQIHLYANSLYHVMLNDFEKALSYLSKININSFFDSLDDNLYFKNDIKKYTIVCFVELGYYENALIQIDSYKHFLNYSKIIPESIKFSSHNFLNLLSEVIFLKMEFDEYRSVQLEKKILLQKGKLNSYLYNWLLKKSIEIRKSGL
jgi:hypothetical protein